MAFNPFLKPIVGIGITKKLGNPDAPDPLDVNGIYQMRKTKLGRQSVRMKFYFPTNPNTPAQIANRTKFQNAMIEWNGLTPEQRVPYTERAKKLMLRPHNVFVRDYYKAN